MDPSSNATEAATYMMADTQRYLHAAWSALVLAIAIPGNVVVLLASFKYRAIKVDKVTVVLIQSIAVSDVGVAGSWIVPRMSSVITEEWIYGDHLCDFTSIAGKTVF